MPSKPRLLESLAALHDRGDRPVAVDRLAARADADPAEVRAQLDQLCAYELVTRADDGSGYAPTITGYELLELDLDDEERVVIEVPDDPDDHDDFDARP